MWDALNNKDIPATLRICAGTDGSVTLLLELLTGKTVDVKTLEQGVVNATPEMAKILEIEKAEEVNNRLVTLSAGGLVYVLARSLSPLSRMPPGMRQDLMRADIPIGRILREHELETRRDILKMDMGRSEFFGDLPVLSREYRIIHKGKTLMWINEWFPVDGRWRTL